MHSLDQRKQLDKSEFSWPRVEHIITFKLTKYPHSATLSKYSIPYSVTSVDRIMENINNSMLPPKSTCPNPSVKQISQNGKTESDLNDWLSRQKLRSRKKWSARGHLVYLGHTQVSHPWSSADILQQLACFESWMRSQRTGTRDIEFASIYNSLKLAHI